MKEINSLIPACRHCRFYKPEGRRGGFCQMLGVPVQSSWQACTLASSPFTTTLKKLEDIFHLEAPVSEESCRNISTEIHQVKIKDNHQTAILEKLE